MFGHRSAKPPQHRDPLHGTPVPTDDDLPEELLGHWWFLDTPPDGFEFTGRTMEVSPLVSEHTTEGAPAGPFILREMRPIFDMAELMP